MVRQINLLISVFLSGAAARRGALMILSLIAIGVDSPTWADSDPAHMDTTSEKPIPWPGGLVPYDVSKLSEPQQTEVRKAMQRWMDTGAQITFVPRSNQVEYIYFTGATNAGNNTTHTG